MTVSSCGPSPPLSVACLRFEPMADGDGGGGEGSGASAEWQPIYDRVQAQVEALAADRARLEAASKVQRESWEAARRLQRSVEELQAAAQEKEAENGRLRAEAADARKKLPEVRQVIHSIIAVSIPPFLSALRSLWLFLMLAGGVAE